MSKAEIQDRYKQPEANEYIIINDVTAQCRLCDWRITEPLTVEAHTEETVGIDGILNKCREHHNLTRARKGATSQHNIFDLLYAGVISGFAAVSSASSTGTFDIPPKIPK